MATVRVFAKVKAKAGKEEVLREKLLDLVKASRGEDGVQLYELFESKDGGEFLLNEEYAGPEEYGAHKSSEHFKQAEQEMAEVLDGELTIWEVDPVEPVL